MPARGWTRREFDDHDAKKPPQEVRHMRYGIYGLGIVVAVSGFAIAVFRFNDLLIRSFGILMTLGGAYLIRVSRTQGQMELRGAQNIGSGPMAGDRPGRLAWISGVVSLAAFGGSFWLMNNDALHGHHNVWTVYAFIACGTISMLVSGYISVLLVRKMFGH
jgi:hypothetical protein